MKVKQARILVAALLFVFSFVLSNDRLFAMDQGSVPIYLQDRGEGVTTSLFGTYIQKGELLVYPFYEYEKKSAEEYKGSELGFSNDEKDYLGKLIVQEALLFFGYGVTNDLAVELEFAAYEAETLTKAKGDTTSNIPDHIKESGFGATQAQVRWRLRRETETQSEIYTAFEVEFPLQKDKKLIGAQDWEFVAAIG